MTQAVAYSEQQNGQQSQSSGLIIHRGPLSAALIRSIGSRADGAPVWPRDGQGSGPSLELAHGNGQSMIQSYNRDTATWLPLYLYGSSVNLAPQGPGAKVTMPMGTTQALLGSYRQIPSWSIPAINAWYETPVLLTAACTGGLIRLEACGTLIHSAATALIYVGIMMDGAVIFDSLTAVQPSIANQVMPYSVVAYYQPLAGPHRWALTLYSGSPGGGLWAGAYQNLWVTEQRA